MYGRKEDQSYEKSLSTGKVMPPLTCTRRQNIRSAGSDHFLRLRYVYLRMQSTEDRRPLCNWPYSWMIEA